MNTRPVDTLSDRPANNNDLRRLQSLIPIITSRFPNGVSQVGTWNAIRNQSTNAAANAETTIPHKLGHIPNGYVQIRSKLGGSLYDPTDGDARWTETSIIVRSTAAADIISLLLF